MPSITVRLSADELQKLDGLAARLELPRSALVRAGTRAVVAQPGLVLDPAASESVAAAPTRQPGKRRNGRKR